MPCILFALHVMSLSNIDELPPLVYKSRMATKNYAQEDSGLLGGSGVWSTVSGGSGNGLGSGLPMDHIGTA